MMHMRQFARVMRMDSTRAEDIFFMCVFTPPASDRKLFYHYTTLEGAKGILESRNLWATHIDYLNDASEGCLHDEAMQAAFAKQLEACDLSVHETAITKKFSKSETAAVVASMLVGKYRNAFKDLYPRFVASLCTHDDKYDRENGLLSQSRGYGTDGGVCLCFDAETFCNFLKEQNKTHQLNMSLKPIKYVKSPSKIPKKIWKGIASKWIKEKDQLKSTTEFLKDLFALYVEQAPNYKHFGFHEENEHRLSVTFHKPNMLDIKMRKRGNMMVPYVEIFKDKMPLPDLLIVGPSQTSRQTADAFKIWLKAKGLGVAVTVSQTPYRS